MVTDTTTRTSMAAVEPTTARREEEEEKRHIMTSLSGPNQFKKSKVDMATAPAAPLQVWRGLAEDARAYAILDWLIEMDQVVRNTPVVRQMKEKLSQRLTHHQYTSSSRKRIQTSDH